MLKVINPQAAAADIGSEAIFVSIAGGAAERFGTVTRELIRLRDHLLAQKVTTFAMEFTGVYWMPLYELLEQTRITVCLVNGAHVKSLPGRKTDVADCMWLAELHSHGLLKAGFVPPANIRRLRDNTRLRDNHILEGASHLLQVQKALELMNIKVHDVISDLGGVSGQRVVRAILAGERNAEVLLSLCEQSILRKKRDRLRDALQGTWARQHLFALKQAWAGWEFSRQLMSECDEEIAILLREMSDAIPPGGSRLEAENLKGKKPSKNCPKIPSLHETLLKILGGAESRTDSRVDRSFSAPINQRSGNRSQCLSHGQTLHFLVGAGTGKSQQRKEASFPITQGRTGWANLPDDRPERGPRHQDGARLVLSSASVPPRWTGGQQSLG